MEATDFDAPGLGEGELDRLWELGDVGSSRRLSPRRREVFGRLLSGESEKQGAAALGISRHTFHSTARQIYDHFGLAGRVALLSWVLGRSGGRGWNLQTDAVSR